VKHFDGRDRDYYNRKRREILPFIPPGSKTVLDVGAGEGEFGYLLKQELGAEVWGVEPDFGACEKARVKLDRVLLGRFEDVLDDLRRGYFDAVVFNDVLEHMVDPFGVLVGSRALISPHGVVVASIPNVRFWGNLKGLIKDKDWKYKTSGVLDATHLRFFTRKSMIRMFHEAGYRMIRIQGINPTSSRNFKVFNFLLAGSQADARYAQFVCVAGVP
jgi:2-polyprenyl-3-methyl-5-hydroxy-6-metoxy-1,4-benzoquinol methylase